MALIHHPDKGGDAEKFKAISCAHAILSNPEKRKLYDRTGELDESDLSEEAAEWTKYFRNMFPKLTTEAIEKFSLKYKFSEDERLDILKVYTKRNGDIDDIMESVILAEDEDRERIVDIINDAIETSELPLLAKWTTDSTDSFVKKKTKKSIPTSGKSAKKKDAADEAFLMQMIANKKGQADAFATICDKYSKPKRKSSGSKTSHEIDDAEFERLQKSLFKGK